MMAGSGSEDGHDAIVATDPRAEGFGTRVLFARVPEQGQCGAVEAVSIFYHLHHHHGTIFIMILLNNTLFFFAHRIYILQL